MESIVNAKAEPEPEWKNDSSAWGAICRIVESVVTSSPQARTELEEKARKGLEQARRTMSVHRTNAYGGLLSPETYWDIPEVANDVLVAQIALAAARAVGLNIPADTFYN